VSRFWSFFFLLMPLAVLAVFTLAPLLGWELPSGVSRMGDEIDFLYRVILFVTGTVFLGTQFFLFYALVKYRDRPGREAWYTHGSKKAEVVWTLIPALVIAGLAALQMPTWRKLQDAKPADEPFLARVIGRRFEWRVVHAGPDGKLDTADDVILTNQLHLPPGRRVWLELRAEDVIHSFYLPQFRFKQDTVPGMKIVVPVDALRTSADYREQRAAYGNADIEDYGALARLLKPANRAVDKFVKEKLDAGPRAAMDEYEPGGKEDAAARAGIVRALNVLIDGPTLENDAAFKEVKRSKATEALLARAQRLNKRDAWKRTINRALIADAYPNIVRRLQKDYEILCAELCGEGHYQMQGKVVVHDDESDFEAWLKEAQSGDPQESGR